MRLACFGIDEKVTNITTNNASNMTKAFGLPGLENIKAKEEESDEDDRMNYEETGVEHDPCYAHTLQLVVKDGFKQAGSITKVLSKAAHIVNFIRQSTLATDILEGERRDEAATCTRWNSQLLMIRSILQLSEERIADLCCPKPLTKMIVKPWRMCVINLCHLKRNKCIEKEGDYVKKGKKLKLYLILIKSYNKTPTTYWLTLVYFQLPLEICGQI
ncbi:hypothetical protein EB796_004843 [Bugula neritina]|uniref:Uncharacterized protein n=1 Tax=Bugula neritina TaxID=10212 RepID=A0A7J7KEX0_BUGNE|nr:hypothetical protein EB796_004843 [Bugula neritina]